MTMSKQVATKQAVKKPIPQMKKPEKRTMKITAPIEQEVELDDEFQETEEVQDEFSETEETEMEASEDETQEEFVEEEEETHEISVSKRREEIRETSKQTKGHANGSLAPTKHSPKPAAQSTPAKTQEKALQHRQSNTQVASRQDVPTETIKSDLIIPRVLLMQSMSKLVKDRKAYAGQIVKSPSGEHLGGITNPGEPGKKFKVIPLDKRSTWTILAAEGNKWLGSEARTNANDNLPWEFTNDEGIECKRLKTIELIGLLPNDIEKLLKTRPQVDEETGEEIEAEIPDNLDDAVLLPVAFSFRSTSFTAGKGVSTFFAKVEAASKQYPLAKPYHYTLEMTCREEANDSGEFFVFEVGNSQKTDKKYLSDAKTWYDQVKTSNVTVEDESESEAKAAKNLKARPTSKSQY